MLCYHEEHKSSLFTRSPCYAFSNVHFNITGQKAGTSLYLFFIFYGGDVEKEEIRFVRQFVGVADTEEFHVIRQIIWGAPRMISSAALDMLIVARCDSETEELLS